MPCSRGSEAPQRASPATARAWAHPSKERRKSWRTIQSFGAPRPRPPDGERRELVGEARIPIARPKSAACPARAGAARPRPAGAPAGSADLTGGDFAPAAAAPGVSGSTLRWRVGPTLLLTVAALRLQSTLPSRQLHGALNLAAAKTIDPRREDGQWKGS